MRSTMQEDAAGAGLHVAFAGSLGDLPAAEGRSLGDVVMLDCPVIDAATLAALARLDLRAAGGDTRLIVSTSVEMLDEVFACMDMSMPVLLVDPNRAERVIALGQVMAGFPAARLRELSEDDRLMLLRLSEQVGQIAGHMDRLAPAGPARAGRSGASAEAPDFAGNGPPYAAKDPSFLSDARMLRRIIRQRQLRARFIEGDLFADPAWDMLLDLAAARAEGKQVSVTSLCIASAVPPTTALRWIGQLVEAGLFQRVCDENDRRRAFIELTDQAVDRLARYFGEIALTQPVPV
ncbi:winged helix DNA-binding protein [Novosphingobium aerophilum]|uniref:winged helix DNA-binding protein n=2 Tax=Novosphingobium TaxID=165696 RepID=UPI003515ED72